MTTKNFDDLATLSNGTPVTGEGRQMTYRELIANALNSRFEEDRNLSPADIYKRGKLADAIERGGDVDLIADQLQAVKNAVAKFPYAPRIVSQIHDKVDADYTPTKEEV